jgi:hypothetical protein
MVDDDIRRMVQSYCGQKAQWMLIVKHKIIIFITTDNFHFMKPVIDGNQECHGKHIHLLMYTHSSETHRSQAEMGIHRPQ